MKRVKPTIFLATLALAASGTFPCLAAPDAQIKDEAALRKEVSALQEQLETQRKQLAYQAQALTGAGATAVRAPFGRFLLIENGAQCLALRVTEHVDFRVVNGTQQYTARYEWFLQSDGSMDFSKANVQQGSGEATEYKGETYVSPAIKAGSFPPLEWSVGDWIYFTIGATPVGGHPPKSEQALRAKNLRMASTEWVRIKDVDAKSDALLWRLKSTN